MVSRYVIIDENPWRVFVGTERIPVKDLADRRLTIGARRASWTTSGNRRARYNGRRIITGVFCRVQFGPSLGVASGQSRDVDVGRVLVDAVGHGDARARLEAAGIGIDQLKSVRARFPSRYLPARFATIADSGDLLARLKELSTNSKVQRAISVLISELARSSRPDIRCLRREEDTVVVRYRKKRLRTGPALILDGTAGGDANPLRVLFPGLKSIEVDVKRQARVFQAWNVTCAKSAFDARSGEALLRRCQSVIDEAARRHTSGLVVTYKSLVSAFTLPPGWGALHFNALRGIDAYAQATCVIIIGRNEVPAEALSEMAAALYFDSDQAIDLTEDRACRPRPYLMADGRVLAIATRCFEDPILAALDFQTNGAETIQAIDRIRSVRAEGKPKDIILVSSPPVDGLVVDEVFRLADPTPLEVAHEEIGPVLPLGAPWLAEALPGLFGSESAAKRAIQAAEPGENGSKSLRILLAKVTHFPPRCVSYRLPRQRGKSSRARLSRPQSLTSTERELAWRHGSDVTVDQRDFVFRLDGQDRICRFSYPQDIWELREFLKRLGMPQP